MDDSKIWLISIEDKIKSLIADEAKNNDILDSLSNTIKQLRAKSTFRLALLHQIREAQQIKGENK